MENQETLDAIAAEVRARAKAWPDPSLVQYDERLADRITDATRRERERIGNSAVLYKALREIRDDILDMIREHRSEDPDSYAHGLLLSIGGACDIALREPPRNCDRFAKLDDARDAFIKIEELPEGNDDGQMREWFRRFAKWSYLLVAKKKGGEK